ncbi:bifunctional glycosyltransferase family 2 protein/CDP-glycerol:glycerophosphate glycerophosphotransferase [Streptomyces sannanensis]|uniref:Bifunctional glycosyltransferase family 2 protein/CDP-glycerol:glycerophosphate glycerophosphotransferase n=1 Tax=Streptomyces sannanensis TaxID=285536 RepID=A0ABP6SAV8_9ACTN
MPRFSVIVPAYKVQAYLHICLDSVLSQSYDDLELIAVDDASPDACGTVIDECAARDRRVTAVHLAERGGAGPARNAGLAAATGDYVLFLDGRDTLVPGALQAVADRLKETNEPDVLVYGHVRALWSGEVVPGGDMPRLTEEGPAPFRLADRPTLLSPPPPAWAMAYRRGFARREDLAFPPGHHADLPWSAQALIAAVSVATLAHACVRRHERRPMAPSRPGAPAADDTPEVFDVFVQYERLFAFVDSRPGAAEWRPLLCRHMAEHFAAVLGGLPQLPRGARAEFARRARAHCRRFHPRGTRHALVRIGARRTLLALRAGRRLAARARTLVALALRGLRAVLSRSYYRFQRWLPVRADLAVFMSYEHHGYGGNPAALEARVRELAPHIRTAWIAEPDRPDTVPAGARRLRPGSLACSSALARARFLVGDAGFGDGTVKRRSQVMLRTPPGTPLKSEGLDLLDRPAAGPVDPVRLMRSVDGWDYLVSANPHSTLVRERAFPGSYTVLEYGQPRADVFRNATAADMARLRASFGIPAGFTALLYVPEHRDYRRVQRAALDLPRLARSLGPRCVVLSRAPRPDGAPPVRSDCSGCSDCSDCSDCPRVVDVRAHPSVEELCLASDALVTDYSPLMFDYVCLDRPVVIHAEDRDVFEAVRGTYFDLRSFPPGAVARTEDELVDIFATGLWRSSRSTQLRTAFRARFCPYDDGRAAERVVRHVFLGETADPPAAVPFPATSGLIGGPRSESSALRP